MMRRMLTVAAVLFAGLFSGVCLTACNTVEGVGEDVGAVGQGMSDAARETGDAISGKNND